MKELPLEALVRLLRTKLPFHQSSSCSGIPWCIVDPCWSSSAWLNMFASQYRTILGVSNQKCVLAFFCVLLFFGEALLEGNNASGVDESMSEVLSHCMYIPCRWFGRSMDLMTYDCLQWKLSYATTYVLHAKDRKGMPLYEFQQGYSLASLKVFTKHQAVHCLKPSDSFILCCSALLSEHVWTLESRGWKPTNPIKSIYPPFGVMAKGFNPRAQQARQSTGYQFCKHQQHCTNALLSMTSRLLPPLWHF